MRQRLVDAVGDDAKIVMWSVDVEDWLWAETSTPEQQLASFQRDALLVSEHCGLLEAVHTDREGNGQAADARGPVHAGSECSTTLKFSSHSNAAPCIYISISHFKCYRCPFTHGLSLWTFGFSAFGAKVGPEVYATSRITPRAFSTPP